MFTVTENSTAYLTVKFYDKLSVLQAPTSLTYRVDDVSSHQSVRSVTALTAGASVEITLVPADNVILNPVNESEQRRLTVVAVYGTGDQVTDEFTYEVMGLDFFS